MGERIYIKSPLLYKPKYKPSISDGLKYFVVFGSCPGQSEDRFFIRLFKKEKVIYREFTFGKGQFCGFESGSRPKIKIFKRATSRIYFRLFFTPGTLETLTFEVDAVDDWSKIIYDWRKKITKILGYRYHWNVYVKNNGTGELSEGYGNLHCTEQSLSLVTTHRKNPQTLEHWKLNNCQQCNHREKLLILRFKGYDNNFYFETVEAREIAQNLVAVMPCLLEHPVYNALPQPPEETPRLSSGPRRRRTVRRPGSVRPESSDADSSEDEIDGSVDAAPQYVYYDPSLDQLSHDSYVPVTPESANVPVDFPCLRDRNNDPDLVAPAQLESISYPISIHEPARVLPREPIDHYTVIDKPLNIETVEKPPSPNNGPQSSPIPVRYPSDRPPAPPPRPKQPKPEVIPKPKVMPMRPMLTIPPITYISNGLESISTPETPFSAYFAEEAPPLPPKISPRVLTPPPRPSPRPVCLNLNKVTKQNTHLGMTFSPDDNTQQRSIPKALPRTPIPIEPCIDFLVSPPLPPTARPRLGSLPPKETVSLPETATTQEKPTPAPRRPKEKKKSEVIMRDKPGKLNRATSSSLGSLVVDSWKADKLCETFRFHTADTRASTRSDEGSPVLYSSAMEDSTEIYDISKILNHLHGHQQDPSYRLSTKWYVNILSVTNDSNDTPPPLPPNDKEPLQTPVPVLRAQDHWTEDEYWSARSICHTLHMVLHRRPPTPDTLQLSCRDRSTVCLRLYMNSYNSCDWKDLASQIGLEHQAVELIEAFTFHHNNETAGEIVLRHWQYRYNKYKQDADKCPIPCTRVGLVATLKKMYRQDVIDYLEQSAQEYGRG